MFVYFDQRGILKEIITDQPFRVGDSKRDRIYVYWEGDHSPLSGWVKYRLANGSETNETQFFESGKTPLVGMELPQNPARNLRFFSYEHTYVEDGEVHAGYRFYEITVPDEVLGQYVGDGHTPIPVENNMVVARVRFVMDSGGTFSTLGAIAFSVEASMGLLTDMSINATQYNYLVSLIGMKFANPDIYDSKGNVSAKFTDSGLSIVGSSLTLDNGTWGFTKVSKKGADGTKRSVGMLLFNFLYDSGTSVDLGSALLLTDTRQVFALGDEDINYLEFADGEIVVSEGTASYLTSGVDLSAIPDWIDERYVKKLGAGSGYRVYMVAPNGTDTNRIASSSATGEAMVLRTSTGQLELPNQKNVAPSGSQAISKAFADDKYMLDRKTTDFHSVTTLRWLNDNNQREMVINGSWIGFYANGNQLLTIRGDNFTYLDKAVKWSDLADLVEKKSPLLNGDTGAIGSYKSDGNGISSATTFAGSDITNTAKGINSFSLGRLNAVEGVGCLAYGNKNTVKGAGSVALGGGNVSGDRIDWTSASASVNNSSAYCISLGENNTTTGRSAVSVGIANKSNGDGSVSVGRGNAVWSKESVAIGRSNTLNKVSTGSYDEQEPDQGNGVVAVGTGLKTPKRWNDVNLENLYWNCVVVGRYNDPYVYGCARSTDLPYKNNCAPVFTLGNGSDDSNRRNSIVTFHNSGFQEREYDWTYFNDYCIFNQICEFRNTNNIFENNVTVWGIVKDKNGVQYLKGGQISDTFINSLF